MYYNHCMRGTPGWPHDALHTSVGCCPALALVGSLTDMSSGATALPAGLFIPVAISIWPLTLGVDPPSRDSEGVQRSLNPTQ